MHACGNIEPFLLIIMPTPSKKTPLIYLTKKRKKNWDYISCENKLKNKGALIPRSLQPTRRYDKKDENSVTNYCAIFRCKKYQKFFFFPDLYVKKSQKL